MYMVPNYSFIMNIKNRIRNTKDYACDNHLLGRYFRSFSERIRFFQSLSGLISLICPGVKIGQKKIAHTLEF